METSMPTLVQPEAPPQNNPLRDRDTWTLDPQEGPEQDHEGEEEMRRRLDEWRCMAANLKGGFTQMPDAVRKDPKLSTSAKLVYEHLLGYMWQQEWCWPGQKRIAAELGISRRTVIRACQELYERGYIDKWRRGQGLTNYYFINPLSFAATTTGRTLTTMSLRLPDNRELVTGSALAALYSTTFYANDDAPFSSHTKECQNGTSRSDTMAQPNVPKSHSNYTKANHSHLNEKRDSDSSGFAASFEKEEVGSTETCSHIAHVTIRNTKTDTTDSNTNSSTRNSKSSSVSQETGGAVHAKAVEASSVEEKLSRWQTLALAHGISLVQQDALDSYIKNCPRPMHIPLLVEQEVDHVSHVFNNAQYLTSNRTQATKLWQYARLRGMDHETLEDTFREWVRVAATIPPYIENKMAWFFKALHLEVLKALLPYERVTPVAEEQPTASQTDEVSTQEQDEQREGEQEIQDAESINQEQDASPVPTSDEQECQEQPAPEPEYLMTEDPDAGWATWASASHWADRLRECVGIDRYSVDVLPTRFDRFGFYLYERSQPEQVWTYVVTSAVIARLEEEKKQRLHSTPRT